MSLNFLQFTLYGAQFRTLFGVFRYGALVFFVNN